MSKVTTVLNVEGMSCQHCVNSVNKAVGELKGVDRVTADLESKTVSVDYDSDQVGLDMIREVIEDQGYEVK
ncbi:MAG: copper chaperone CopZ [Firmicutes bacterium]|nr:copper chaperone CopZ [Bacillota bacterium]